VVSPNDTTEDFEDPTSIESRLADLERKFEQRGYNTRPIWEAVQEKITNLEGDIQNLKRTIELLSHQSQTQQIKDENNRRYYIIKLLSGDQPPKVPGDDASEIDTYLEICDNGKIVSRFSLNDILHWWSHDPSDD